MYSCSIRVERIWYGVRCSQGQNRGKVEPYCCEKHPEYLVDQIKHFVKELSFRKTDSNMGWHLEFFFILNRTLFTYLFLFLFFLLL